ncbi:precorrin-2 dehydrogenase/sirohydrochlorin ferrochelatase family protein [Erythrobacter sp.]|uniref:precorrin-2 dehydrogenase/sirohydrochlorin ferrochelatase family protein n=1 Tax=Erythrobacter sp. TaxID=1042 RepID=UPI002EC9FA87|nr:NAD(P)-dependent oxidoreductase [Erythrobacter sp.]
MLPSLPLFHRIAGQRVLVLGEGSAAEPKARLVERAGGIVLRDEQRAVDEGVRLAFVAYEDASACETAAIRLRCAGLLVNVVDRPDLCDFTTPSILDRTPLVVAVGTGGASAGLAKHVRLRLERLLPQGLGALASALFAARTALRKAFPEASERRRAIDAALGEGGHLDVLREGSADRVEAWLAHPNGAAGARTERIDLASDDPEDLTIRQARWLGEADVVCSEAGVPDAILARARADAVRLTCEQAPSCAQGTCAKAAAAGQGEGLTVILRRETVGERTGE